MKYLQYFLILFLAGTAFSCKSTYELKATGDRVRINLKDKAEMEVELLAFQNELIYFETGNQFYKTPISDIERIRVLEEYRPHGKAPIMISLGLINTSLGFSMVKDDWGTDGLRLGVFGLAVLAWANVASPNYQFRPPLNQNKKNRLKLFCRYQYGLTSEQMEALLKHSGQKEFLLVDARQ